MASAKGTGSKGPLARPGTGSHLSLIRWTGGVLLGLPFDLAVVPVELGKQPKHARRLVGHDAGLPVRCGNGQGAAPSLAGLVVVQLEASSVGREPFQGMLSYYCLKQSKLSIIAYLH